MPRDASEAGQPLLLRGEKKSLWTRSYEKEFWGSFNASSVSRSQNKIDIGMTVHALQFFRIYTSEQQIIFAI